MVVMAGSILILFAMDDIIEWDGWFGDAADVIKNGVNDVFWCSGGWFWCFYLLT